MLLVVQSVSSGRQSIQS